MHLSRRDLIKFFLSASVLNTKDVFSDTFKGRHLRRIPSTDEYLPVIGMGTWLTLSIDIDDSEELRHRSALLHEFLDLGGGMLDSSPMYGIAEKVIGLGLGGEEKSDKLFAATKVWTTGNRQGLLQMEDSRLLWKLPRFDLMQVHNLLDWETHLPTLREMKERGDIRYLGVTTSHGRRHEELADLMTTEPLDFVQLTYNIIDREAEKVLLPLAQEKGIAVIVNRPFQGGALFDRFKRYPLPAIASELECHNWAQYFLKFIVSHPAVTCAIPATSQLVHLRENMAAAYGKLPDKNQRQEMIDSIRRL